MMNSDLMLAESRAMAESLLAEEAENTARVTAAYQKALCRPPPTTKSNEPCDSSTNIKQN